MLVIPAMVAAMKAVQKEQKKAYQQKGVHCLYTNWKGETEWRKIIPMSIYFGSTDYHPEEQWLMIVWDLDKDAQRIYAIKDIKEWKVP